MTAYMFANALCAGCFNPQYWGLPHECHYKPSAADSRGVPLSDADIDRIAQRLAAILQSAKKNAEQ